MSVTAENLAITSIEVATAFTLDDDYLFTADELNDATLSQGLEKVDITAARGAKMSQLKRNKTVTGKITNALLSLPAMAADLGTTVKRDQSSTFRWKDVLTSVADGASNTTVSLQYAPAGTVGSNIYGVYMLNTDGVTLGKEFAYASGATATADKYIVNGSALTFLLSDVPVGSKIVVWYDRTVTGVTKIENLASTVAKDVHLVLDCLAEDKMCNVYYVQIDIPKASLNGTFDVGASDNQIMQNIEFESLAVACSGSTAKFWDMLIVDDAVIEAAS